MRTISSNTRQFALLVVLLTAAAGRAAADSSIAGTVTAGPRSEPIANARVTLRGAGRARVATTDGRGRYELTALAPDVPYEITVEADGLRPATRGDVTVSDGETRSLNLNLELADLRYAVNVNGVVREVGSTPPEIGRAVGDQDVEDLPSITRSTTKYALLDPHVRQAIGLGADFQDATRLSVNAGSYRHTGYMLDGMSAYDWIYANSPQATVPPGAVREMKVLTGPTSAEYGMSTTGVLSVVTSSGGQTLDGEGVYLFRPSGLQSRPPLATMDVPNSRVDGAVRAGGPIRSGRSYFFASYERADQDRGAYIQSPVPGFFTGETTEQYGLLRIDSTLNRAHALTVRVNGSGSTANNANDRVSGFNQPSFGRESHAQSLGGQVSERAAWSSAVNEVRLSYTAYTPDSATPLQGSTQIVRPNYSTEGYSTENWVHAHTLQASDVVTLSRGRHLARVGGEIVRLDASDYSFTPLGTYTFAPGAPKPDEHPLTFSQTFGTADLTYGQTQASVFVQDEWRLSSRVTASLGLRYEVQSITDDRANFAPRLGASWDVSGDGRTVVRSGAGIYYDQYYMYLNRRYMTLGPQAPQASYTWNWGDPGFPVYPNSFASLPGGKAAPARDIMIPGDKIQNPRAGQVSAGVERQVRPGLTIYANGVYAHTIRQMRVDDINHPAPFDRAAPGQVRTPQQANLTRPYTTYEGVLVRDIAKIVNTAESTYRSLDLGVTGRAGRFSHFAARYVWSSSITHSMFYADANSGVPNEWWPDWDQYEAGPGDFHQPHRLVADAVVQFPYTTQLSVVATVASGLPVNPITGRDNNGDSYTVDRPVGYDRNSFRGPAQVSFDVAGSKRFRLGSALQAEGRFEVFNLLNRENFIKVNNIYGEGPAPLPTFLAPVAGIVNTDPSRQIQFSVKLIF